MADLVIRGGRVVTPHGLVAADIAIEGEYIAEVGPELPGGRDEIDASGLTVFPGAIDVHVHFNEPGRTEWEGAETGSKAFKAGGGTLYFDMPLNSTPCTVNAANFDAKRQALAASSVTDFALWGGLIPGDTAALLELAELGVIGFKAFMCNSGLPEFPRADDLTLFEGMRAAAQADLPVAVHAENEEITAGLTRRLLEKGRNDIPAFLESRPVVAETEAITRAGRLAREAGCRLHVVHISSGRGVMAALEARAGGTDISIETCPHYLFFTEDDLYRMGALAKCAPPLRSADERDSLLDAVNASVVDIVGSDHSPCQPEMKQRESFFDIWGGIAGVQSTLAVLLTLGVTPERIAALIGANPARRFRIAEKGSIAPGMHADLALVDTHAPADTNLIHRHRTSPYAGARLRGAIRRTLLRGGRMQGNFVRPSKGI